MQDAELATSLSDAWSWRPGNRGVGAEWGASVEGGLVHAAALLSTRRGGRRGRESSGGDRPRCPAGPGTACVPASEDGPALTRATAEPIGRGRVVEPSPPRRAGPGLLSTLKAGLGPPGRVRVTQRIEVTWAQSRGSMSVGPPRAAQSTRCFCNVAPCRGHTRKATHGAFTAAVTAPRAGGGPPSTPPSQPPELGTFGVILRDRS